MQFEPTKQRRGGLRGTDLQAECSGPEGRTEDPDAAGWKVLAESTQLNQTARCLWSGSGQTEGQPTHHPAQG